MNTLKGVQRPHISVYAGTQEVLNLVLNGYSLKLGLGTGVENLSLKGVLNLVLNGYSLKFSSDLLSV